MNQQVGSPRRARDAAPPADRPRAGGWLARARYREGALGYLLVLPALLIVALILVYPTVYNLVIALHQWSWSAPASAPRPFVGLRNFREILSSASFWNSLRVSVLLVVFALAIEYVLGLGLALMLNRRFVGQRLFRAIFMLPMVLAPIVVGIQWRYLLSGDFGVLNYLLGLLGLNPPDWLSEPRYGLPILVTVDTWVYLPFATLILLAGLQQVPQDVYEAADMDGAGPLARFRYVTLPFLGPSSALVLLLRGAAIFQTFDVVYILTGGGPGQSTEVLGLLLYHVAFGQGNMGQAAALAILVGLLGMALGAVLANVIRTEVRLF